MHDTKMFLFTHRYGFETGLSFLCFFSRNLIQRAEVDCGKSLGSGGLDGESAVESGSAGTSLS